MIKAIINIVLAFLLEKYNWVIIALGTIAIQYFIIKKRSRSKDFVLYLLTIKNLENKNRYLIGFYSAEKLAKEIADRYLSEIPGFNDNHCESYINKVEIVTFKGRYGNSIYVYTGWNEDDNGVRDIWTQYYFTRPEYEKELTEQILSKVHRDNWTMNIYEAGMNYWEEGIKQEKEETDNYI